MKVYIVRGGQYDGFLEAAFFTYQEAEKYIADQYSEDYALWIEDLEIDEKRVDRDEEIWYIYIIGKHKDNYVLLDKSPVFKSAVKRDSATPVHIDNNTLLKNDVIRYVTYDKRSDLTINELVDRCDKYVARYGVDYNAKDRN